MGEEKKKKKKKKKSKNESAFLFSEFTMQLMSNP